MREAYEWHSAKDNDLAMQFMLCVRQTVDAIEKSPLRFPIAIEDIRNAHVKKFPCDVWYVTDGDSAVVACIHAKQDGPSVVRKRLKTLERH